MREIPILFSAPMIRALLDGSKTQTRRVMKIQPPSDEYKLMTCSSSTDKKIEGKHHWATMINDYSIGDGSQPYFTCPYGYAGDQLWVRETFAYLGTKNRGPFAYRADTKDGEQVRVDAPWKPSIHMPRWASRITIEITGIRVERLNDCSEADAIAEGITGPHFGKPSGDPWWPNFDKSYPDGMAPGCGSAIESYQSLWESINGAGSWAANPWVWVVEFKVVKP